MAVVYERIVQEDLNVGVGTVEVTMPGGGTQTGHQISVLTFPHVGFAAHLSASMPVGNSAVIIADAKEWDVGGWYGTDGRFAPTVPGHYFVEGWVDIQSFSATARLSIFQTGTRLQSVDVVRAGAPASVIVSALVYLNGADFVELRMDHDNGSPLTVQFARFSAFAVGSVARA